MNIILKYAILLSFVLFSACNKDRANLKITDFSKKQTVVLKPYKFYPYAMLNIKVEGYVDDTIRIVRGEPFYDIILIGEIDTLIQSDYYGGGKRTFTFAPYRATEGKLEIDIEL